jgi:phosphoribosylamine--glycine ligase
MSEAASEVIAPTLAALAADGAPFRGLLYAGLMKTAEGLKVVEFNCRFGDPETQVVLPLMASSLLDLILTVAEGRSLADAKVEARPGAAVATVLASGGYPGSYEKGKAITVPNELESDDVIVFHAGTASSEDGLVTSGGRVLAVTAIAETFAAAANASRAAAARIEFDGAFHRSDIGWRERARLDPQAGTEEA